VPMRLTTPFGRRSLTLALAATQTAEANRPPDKVAHKSQVSRAISTAGPTLSVLEPAPAVLNALLSFFHRAKLTGENSLIVRAGRGIKLTLGFDLAPRFGASGGVSAPGGIDRRPRPERPCGRRSRSTLCRRDIAEMVATEEATAAPDQAKLTTASPSFRRQKKFSRPHTCSRRAAPTVAVALTAGGR
jgi:Replication protein C N-terminal domain